MKTLEQIKNDYAVSKGYYDFDDLLIGVINYEILSEQITDLMILAQKECLKRSSEHFEANCNKYAITNENNIIR